ncbi:hypothetical protein Cylst_0908 [Cylindrospermum stagnale PCC 7417]|uniref:CsbD-like domain-containing protein n=1 Tax=Cylindrospermum stagnale PCC 7417 TaxID=56107 RepID=K9WSQ1_9NOST|nr:hypothetical protein Cylst_0908 [Cylindrospermum stagnale PCC 7417]
MIQSQQVHKFLLSISLVLFISTGIAFGFAAEDSWAATSFTQLHTQIATINRAEAIAKNIQGKTQEAIGNITGDPKDQVIGRAKQAESQIRNTAEDVKDNVRLTPRAKAVKKNVEGKTQNAIGKITGDSKDQAVGTAKQVGAGIIHTVEDVKDKVKDIIN